MGRGERIVREKEKHHEYEFNSIWGKELLNDHSEQMVAFFFCFFKYHGSDSNILFSI